MSYKIKLPYQLPGLGPFLTFLDGHLAHIFTCFIYAISVAALAPSLVRNGSTAELRRNGQWCRAIRAARKRDTLA